MPGGSTHYAVRSRADRRGRAGYASADIRLERPVSEDGVHPSGGWSARGVEDVLHADMIAHPHAIEAAIRLTYARHARSCR